MLLGTLSATLLPALAAVPLVTQADLTASRLAPPKPQQPKVPGALKVEQVLVPTALRRLALVAVQAAPMARVSAALPPL